MEPAAPKRLVGRFRIPVVAEHHIVAAHDHFAHGGAVAGNVVHLQIHHAQIRACDRVRHALPRLDLGAFRRRQRIPLRPPCADSMRAIGFRQAIGVRDVGADLLGRADHGGRGRRAGGHDLQPALEADAVRGAILRQSADHHGRAAQMRYALGLGSVPPLCRIHLPQADMARAGSGYGPGKTPAVAMEQRQRPEINGAAVRPCSITSPSAFRYAPRCVNITPFGNPVVPLV